MPFVPHQPCSSADDLIAREASQSDIQVGTATLQPLWGQGFLLRRPWRWRSMHLVNATREQEPRTL